MLYRLLPMDKSDTPKGRDTFFLSRCSSDLNRRYNTLFNKPCELSTSLSDPDVLLFLPLGNRFNRNLTNAIGGNNNVLKYVVYSVVNVADESLLNSSVEFIEALPRKLVSND